MIVEVLQGWIDQDRKHTALKALQGLIWGPVSRAATSPRPRLSRRGTGTTARVARGRTSDLRVFLRLGAGAEAVLLA
jgi:hypothetical protein